jgi:2-iminobutanoate/2-iminopropanoate deaminase
MPCRVSWTVLTACYLITLSTVIHAQQAGPTEGFQAGFQRRANFGAWSKNIFADSVSVTGPAKIIYLAGMGAEDENTGTILHRGDFYEQCRYAYSKIKKILAAQGATMADVVKITTYVTDIRYRPDYAKCRAEALGDIPPPTHTFVNVSQLACPGMMIEVDATAAIAAK